MASDSRPSLSVLVDLAEAASDMERLYVLDRIWTRAEGTAPTDEDRAALISLAGKIDSQIETVERQAQALRDHYETHRAWFNERITAQLQSMDPQPRADVEQFIGAADGDVAARGREIADEIASRAGAERDELRAKIPGLRDSNDIVTDLSKGFVCNFLAGAVLAELALCPETLGIGCGAAVVLVVEAHMIGC